ncbi:MAG TPA: excinuclease ABC subunit UvrC [Candidatus Ozemobacteraceae bacterium]|nr:excinuclease ABC subunit UvrC [Candidatus Ozemobacteraceae bacterium]
MIEREKLDRLLGQIPAKPGVYIMRNTSGQVIYVGKSRKLVNRVRSYFRARHRDAKTNRLVAAVADLEFVVTDTESEALILENNLIKKHKPWYNIRLKDSKTHPYLMVTTSETYPRILKVRRVVFNDGNLYFGPFTDEYGLKRIIEFLNTTFRLCSSGKLIDPERPAARKQCLRHDLGACRGACYGRIPPDEYRALVDRAVRVLTGKEPPDLAALNRTMEELAAEFRFEEAAEIRDTIDAFTSFMAAQKVEFLKPVDGDIWGLSESGDLFIASVFFIRDGKLLGRRTIETEREPRSNTGELLGTLMSRFYDANLIPHRILTSLCPLPLNALREMLEKRSGHVVRIATPRRGRFKKLLALANQNALELMKNLRAEGEGRVADGVLELERLLSLHRTPRRIECVDISHVSGVDPVASLVTAINGVPKKSEYRLYHIKTASGGDDPASIGEVTRRRFTRRLEEGSPLCDLFVVDGGITQVRSARAVLDELGIDRDVWGLAKKEELLVPHEGEPVRLPHTSSALRLLVRLRNEAHRFANAFQKKVHGRTTMRSALMNLPGVGEKTLRKVIDAYGSVLRASEATPEELAGRAGIPLKTACLIAASLRGKAVP